MLIVLLLAVFLSGCVEDSSFSTLIGTWKNQELDLTYTFEEDGSCIRKGNTTTTDGTSTNYAILYEYEEQPNQVIQLTFHSYVYPPTNNQGADYTFSYELNDNNTELTITYNGESQTFQRV